MKITENCYAVLGLGFIPPWTVNSGFVAGKDTTLIIDTGPTFIAAQTIFGYATNVKPGNKIKVINTEKHLDHIGGNSLFKNNGIEIYGYPGINRNTSDLKGDIDEYNRSILNKVRREAREESIFYKNTEIINPDILVEDNEEIKLGEGLNATILHTPGHTPTNISVYLPDDGVLYCGDCLTQGYIPNLEAGNKEDWIIWLSSLDRISKLDISYIVPGHGNIIYNSDINIEMNRVQKILMSAINGNKAPTLE